MKRPIFTSRAATPVLTLLVLGAGCSAPEHAPAPSPTPAREAGWIMPPSIASAERTPNGLIVRGQATPLGRVVLRGAGDTAYATGADAQGQFELRVQRPAVDTLFIVETQNGQDAAPAPYRMLASHDPDGPIVLLAPGASSRRLDRGGPLDVIDGDGRAVVASGRTQPGATVSVTAAGQAPVDVRAGADGRWSLALDAAADITVAGHRYVHPGSGRGTTEGLVLERVQGGWRLSWALSPHSVQTSWFPAGV